MKAKNSFDQQVRFSVHNYGPRPGLGLELGSEIRHTVSTPVQSDPIV